MGGVRFILKETKVVPLSIKNICIYCGSSNKVDESYKQSAEAVARLLAEKGYSFVYGGGHVGLMGIVAETALKSGAKVTGIITEYLRDREVQQENLTELQVVPNMHVRKATMFDKADAFLVLPGGLGTVDEVFEVLTWKQLGIHNKPVVFFNQNGFWDPAIRLVENIVAKGFAPQNNLLIYHVATTPEQILDILGAPPDPFVSAESKWQ
jgi:uncharacterized protein (TIGR00730 family)